MKALFLADAKPKEPLRHLVKSCEIVVLLGDLFYDWIAELKDIDIPIIGVSGNHDSGNPLESIGAINLHLNTFTHNGIKFGGFNGDMDYVYVENNEPYYKNPDTETLRNDLQELSSLEPVDVFISHFPSLGTLDIPEITGRRGIKAFREYIDRVNPKYHFHGHMHKPATTLVNKTEVTCVYPYLIQELIKSN